MQKAKKKPLNYSADLQKMVKVEMPIAYNPWGNYFGMFADKFGMHWNDRAWIDNLASVSSKLYSASVLADIPVFNICFYLPV